MTDGRRRVVPVVALTIAAIVFGAVMWRILRGVDFTDEAFYLAIPLRFVLGDRPFVDDYTVAQNAGLLIYPLIALFHRVAHGTAGIVLFARVSWLVLAAIMGAVIFRCFRRQIAWPAALLVALISVAYIPYNLPALSYNTLGAAFFALGIFIVLTPLLDDAHEAAWTFPLGGAAHAAATFAYPTLALPVLAFAALLLALCANRRMARIAGYIAGGVIVALALLPPILRAGLHSLREVFQYSSTGNLAGGSKISVELGNLWHAGPHPLLLVAVIALLVLARLAPALCVWLLPAIPLVATRSTFEGLMRGNAFVVYFGALAPALAVAVRNRRLSRLVGLGVITPSLIAGVVTAWTSGNGAIAATVGMFPACIASGVLLAELIRETAEASRRRWLVAPMALSPAVSLAALLTVLYSGDVVYRDAPIAALTARVDRGPYWGLYTTPANRARLLEISDDVERFVANRPRVLFYWSFSAGYLIADRRPAACCVWIFQNGPRVGMDADCFRRFLTGHNLVVKLGSEGDRDPLDDVVREHAQIIARRRGYFIAAEVPR